MKPIIELLAECNEFIKENPCEYGLELTVRDVKIIAEALEKQIEEEKKLQEIWKKINNAHYFSDMKARNFYNLIHEVAEIIKPGYEEIGKEYLDEEE